MSYSKQAAENLAFEAVLFLAARPELCTGLLSSAGLEAGQLAGLAKDPEFGLHVLDFILEDDRRVMDFAGDHGIPPEEVLHARTALSGPGSFGWDAE